MGKILTAKQVKKLPVGTDIAIVNERTGAKGLCWIIKSGKKKVLRDVYDVHDIKDRDGYRYEEVDLREEEK